jgi:hypothetical protein
MFVIPCKFNPRFPHVVRLVQSIRDFHPNSKILVVDSDSTDKSYVEQLKVFGVTVADICNRNWMVGAYWYGYNTYPNEEFYYFLHDSMVLKGNIDYLREADLTTLMYFDRTIGNFNSWGNLITAHSKYFYVNSGLGCYGPIFFCKNIVMYRMRQMRADIFLPRTKAETGYCEGAYGFFFESQGYDLSSTSLYGDVLANERVGGKSGPFPHFTKWQYPIEKFYASPEDPDRR